MTKVMSLRLPDEVHEALRQEAFRNRSSITSIIINAIKRRQEMIVRGGCDVCGQPHVMVSTPGGIRFCEKHRPS